MNTPSWTSQSARILSLTYSINTNQTHAVNPCYIYGPLADTFPYPEEPSQSRLSTATHFFRLLYPDARFPSMSGYIDVRDTARAHVLAITAHNNPNPDRRKRFPLTSPHPFNWDIAVELIATNRPSLKPRLFTAPSPTYPRSKIIPPTDYQRVEDVLGLKVSEYHTLESTVLDTIDSLVKLEEYWLDNGHALPEIAPR